MARDKPLPHLNLTTPLMQAQDQVEHSTISSPHDHRPVHTDLSMKPLRSSSTQELSWRDGHRASPYAVLRLLRGEEQCCPPRSGSNAAELAQTRKRSLRAPHGSEAGVTAGRERVPDRRRRDLADRQLSELVLEIRTLAPPAHRTPPRARTHRTVMRHQDRTDQATAAQDIRVG